MKIDVTSLPTRFTHEETVFPLGMRNCCNSVLHTHLCVKKQIYFSNRMNCFRAQIIAVGFFVVFLLFRFKFSTEFNIFIDYICNLFLRSRDI
jgi:hypothetical protein